MKKLNIDQKKLLSEGLMNLSVAFVSIGIISPLVTRVEIDINILISILILSILTIVNSIFSISLMNK